MNIHHLIRLIRIGSLIALLFNVSIASARERQFAPCDASIVAHKWLAAAHKLQQGGQPLKQVVGDTVEIIVYGAGMPATVDMMAAVTAGGGPALTMLELGGYLSSAGWKSDVIYDESGGAVTGELFTKPANWSDPCGPSGSAPAVNAVPAAATVTAPIGVVPTSVSPELGLAAAFNVLVGTLAVIVILVVGYLHFRSRRMQRT